MKGMWRRSEYGDLGQWFNKGNMVILGNSNFGKW